MIVGSPSRVPVNEIIAIRSAYAQPVALDVAFLLSME
jgi:hypothetical protein